MSVVVGFLFESLRRKRARSETYRLGLLAAHSAAWNERHVLGAMRSHHPVPERADVARAGRYRWKPDRCVLGNKNDVRRDAQLLAAGQTVSVHHRDHGFWQITQAQPVFHIALQRP